MILTRQHIFVSKVSEFSSSNWVFTFFTSDDLWWTSYSDHGSWIISSLCMWVELLNAHILELEC